MYDILCRNKTVLTIIINIIGKRDILTRVEIILSVRYSKILRSTISVYAYLPTHYNIDIRLLLL